MVRSIIFVSAVVAALATAVSAVPAHDGFVGIGADYVDTGNIYAHGDIKDVVNSNNLNNEEFAQEIDARSERGDWDFDFNRHSGGNGGHGHHNGRPGHHAEEFDSSHVCHEGCNHHGEHSSGLWKREEPAAPVRISKTVGMKGKKMMAKKAAAAKKAAPAKQ